MRLSAEVSSRAVLFVAVGFLCFWQLGSAPLNETDEGFAANRAASFFRHGTFLVSYDDVDTAAPQFRKPPLLYWTVALCLKTIGWNMWAVRLPAAAAGFGSCVLIYLLFRQRLGEWVAQLSVLAFALAPFVLWHIRTAMLEMPLLFLVLLSMHLMTQHRDRPWAPIVAGMACGAAVLLKGGAGLLAPLAAAACTVALCRPMGKTLLRVVVMLAVTALPIAFYILILPPELRAKLIESATVHEGVGRLSHMTMGRQMKLFTEPLLRNLRWHVPAAVCGLVIASVTLWRKKPLREWLWLALIIGAPVVLLGVKQVVPYPRYFIPVYPFVVALSALFCVTVVENRVAALLLVPFACWSAVLEPGALRWTPVAAALIILIKTMTGCLPRATEHIRMAVTALLYFAIIWPSHLSAMSVGVWPLANERPMPEVARLAEKAADIIPKNEKLVAGTGFRCHTALFYSQRAITLFPKWLSQEFVPGSTRYGLFAERQYVGIPALRVEEIARDGFWQLVRLEIDPSTNIRNVLLAPDRDKPEVAAALDLLGAGYQYFGHGLLVTSVVNAVDSLLATNELRLSTSQGQMDYVSLEPGAVVEWELSAPRSVSGVNLVPIKRQENVADIAVEAFDRSSSSWREVGRVNTQPDGNLDRASGRIVQARGRAVRVRFSPVTADKLRLVKLAPPRSRLARLEVLTNDGGPEGTLPQ